MRQSAGPARPPLIEVIGVGAGRLCDPGYRGEVRVIMINHGPEPYLVACGDRIAQLVLGLYASAEWELSEDLVDSRRGEGGFGSTGS